VQNHLSQLLILYTAMSKRSNRNTLFPGSTPTKLSSLGNSKFPIPSPSLAQLTGKSESKERRVGTKLQPANRLPDKQLQSGFNAASSSLGPAKRLRGAQNNREEAMEPIRTRAEERIPPRTTYHEFMVLDQAGPANIGCDDTKERNLVAIKRFHGAHKRSIGKIEPFTSDHVVSIRETFYDNDDLVVVYERMDVSLRQVTSILQGPFKQSHIAVICKQVS
jgi:hypothetical protein